MISYELEIREEAQQELNDGYIWYEFQQDGIGKKFISLVKEYINNLKIAPFQNPLIYKKKRAVFIQDFPYQIIYAVYETKIVIYSVFHTKRNPKIWKKR
ncbi:MAG: type II toxin-antitoxin system RelE/ParE family toxin [Bacteroidetes bacterium]|nr:MAG: type II toxin-antitoxin system RelE/ParE family toxin [Bacteroidota bacterium]